MDLYCQVCGEPFEHYPVVHDMDANERREFLGGFGCDRCKGRVPATGIPQIAQIMALTMDTIGVGDLDGVASTMDEYSYMDVYDGSQW